MGLNFTDVYERYDLGEIYALMSELSKVKPARKPPSESDARALQAGGF